MQKYDISEPAFPCLIFTDESDFERHVIVSLERDDPLKSFCQHVLLPLSEQFRALCKYWKRRDSLRWILANVDRARHSFSTLPVEIEVMAIETNTQRSLIEAQHGAIQAQLDELSRAKAQREEERASIAPEQADVVQKLRLALQAVVAGECTFHSDGHQDLEMARLERRLSKEEQRLKSYEDTGLALEANEISRLQNESRSLNTKICDLELKRKAIEEELVRARATLMDWSPEKLSRESALIQNVETQLDAEGYGDKVVRTDRPSVFAAIEAMLETGKLGVRRQSPSDKEEEMRSFEKRT